MPTYTTATLAEALGLGEGKSATRELRKFLRTDFKAREVATPGKGGRYAIDLTKRDLTAMGKRLAAWQKAEAEAKAARAALLAGKVDSTPEAAPASIEDDADDASDEVAGPSDEEIAAMLADEAE